MNHGVKQRGFTLIELMLAMAFVSLLLLAVSMAIIQIANIYNKGLIIKEINQSSREIGDELDQAMKSSGTFSLTGSPQRYINNAVGGRLCLGQYSYVWNYGIAISKGNSELNKFTNGTVINFVKVPDSGGAYCTLVGNPLKYPQIDPTNSVEMIRNSDHKLSLHSLSIKSSTGATDALSSQQLYRVSYSIGTSDMLALNDTQTACKAPDQQGADATYCSIQQFNLVLRVVNGVN